MQERHAKHPYFEIEEAASRLEDSCIDSFLSRRGSENGH